MRSNFHGTQPSAPFDDSLSPSTLNLQSYIDSVISSSHDLHSNSFRVALSSFQKYVKAKYQKLVIENEAPNFLNDLFLSISTAKLSISNNSNNNNNTNNTNNNIPLYFLIFSHALIGIDIGNKISKANYIARELPLLPPSDDPTVYSYLEKILIWFSNNLGSTMHMILQPLREKIWNLSVLKEDQNSIITSLYLLNILLKNFPSSLNANFENIQNLVMESIQSNSAKIRKQSVRVLESAFKLTETPHSAHIWPLFDKLTQLVLSQPQTFPPDVICSLFKMCMESSDFASAFKFAQYFGKYSLADANLNEHVLPFVFLCSPSAFDDDQIRQILTSYNIAIKKETHSHRSNLCLSVGKIGFMLSQRLHRSFGEEAKILFTTLRDLSDKSDEVKFATLSLMSDDLDEFNGILSNTFTSYISSVILKGIAQLAIKWPLKAPVIRKKIVSVCTADILNAKSDEAIIYAFNSLKKFNIPMREMTDSLLFHFSTYLSHPNFKVRKSCANFLLQMQSLFPTIQLRLLSAVGAETYDELRLSVFKRIEGKNDNLIMPLLSLFHDPDPVIRDLSLEKLCKIPNATPFITNYVNEIISCLKQEATFTKEYLHSISIISDFSLNLVKPYSDLIVKKILERPLTSRTALKNLTTLVPFSNGVEINSLVSLLSSSLSKHSPPKRMIAALDLLTASVQSTALRETIRTTHSSLFLKLIELSKSVVRSKEMKMKLLTAFLKIGAISPQKVQHENSNEEKMTTIQFIPFIDLTKNPKMSQLLNLSVITSLHTVMEILSDESLINIQPQAVEALLSILKFFPPTDETIEYEILQKIIQICKNSMTSMMGNIPILLMIFGEKIEPLIPFVIQSIFNNWGKIDTFLLLRTIDWISISVPNFFREYVSKITVLITTSLSLQTPLIVKKIMATIANFSDSLKYVDYIVIPSLMNWIETNAKNTDVANDALLQFKNILVLCDVTKFSTELIKMFLLIVKQNPDLTKSVTKLFLVLQYQMKNDFLIFLPELLNVFDLRSEPEFESMISSLKKNADFEANIKLAYGGGINQSLNLNPYSTTIQNSNSNSNPNSNPNSGSNSNSNSNPNINTNSNINANVNTNINANVNAIININTNTNTNANQQQQNNSISCSLKKMQKNDDMLGSDVTYEAITNSPMLPNFKRPNANWDAYEWGHWCDEFIPLFLVSSPSAAITACFSLCERDYNIRSLLFPISFSLFVNNITLRNIESEMSVAMNSSVATISTSNELLNDVLKVVMESKTVPVTVLGHFVRICELLEVSNQRIPVSWEVLAQKAIKTGMIPLALRFTEHIFEIFPDKAAESLVSLNMLLGLYDAANAVLLYSNDLKETLNKRLGKWEDTLSFYSEKLKEDPKNEAFRQEKYNALNKLGRYIDLYNDTLNDDISVYSASAALQTFSFERFCEIMSRIKYEKSVDDSDTYKIYLLLESIHSMMKNDFEKSKITLQKLKDIMTDNIFPVIAEDYARSFPNLCHTCVLEELEDAMKMKSLLVQLESPVVAVRDTAQNEINSIERSWDTKFEELYEFPKLMYDHLIVKSLVFNDDQMIPYFIKFLKANSLNGFSQSSEIVLKWLKNNFETYRDIQYIKILMHRNSANPQKATEKLSKLNDHFELLANWYYEDKQIEKSIEVFINNNLESKNWLLWSKLNFLMYDKTKDFQYLIISFRGLLEGLQKIDKSNEKNEKNNNNSNNNNKLEFSLKVLSIIFDNSNYPLLFEIFINDYLEKIDSSIWLPLLPQLIARITSVDSKLRETVQLLILHICNSYPIPVLSSLIVPLTTSADEKHLTAHDLVNKIHSKFTQQVDDTIQFSRELLKIAQTQWELWYNAIDEASKALVLHQDKTATLNLLETLHHQLRNMNQESKSLYEVLFEAQFGPKLLIAEENLKGFAETKDEILLSKVWSIYVDIFQQLRPFIASLEEISLKDVSPALSTLKSSIFVPGRTTTINRFDDNLLVIKSKQRPRKIAIYGDDGVKKLFLLKPNEDTRLDERAMQLFTVISSFLKPHLKIETYIVLPISSKVGLIGWIENCETIFELIKNERKKWAVPLAIELNLLKNKEACSLQTFKKMLTLTKGDEIRNFLMETSMNANYWVKKRLTYTSSLAATSIAGYLIGIGDRHLQNIMILNKTAKIVHIDFGDCFEVLKKRKKWPEKVPFRLTRTFLNGLEVTQVDGTFRKCCEDVMKVLRTNGELILELLETFIYDPLLNCEKVFGETAEIIGRIKDKLNGTDFEPGESLGCEEQVDRLIKEATNIENLAVMYSGWNPWL